MGLLIFGTICFIMLFLAAGALIYTSFNGDNVKDDLLAFGFCFLFGLFFMAMSFVGIEDLGHKRGQIEAANGNQQYHLTTQPNNTTRWEYKEK